jgi:hypothetical protein
MEGYPVTERQSDWILKIERPDAPAVPAHGARRPPGFFRRCLIPIFLFLLTILTTMIAGSWYKLPISFPDYGALARYYLAHPEIILQGWSFSFAIIGILLAHELGHYLACRYYRIRATLPHFIPAPTLIGTFGAFIKLKQPVPSRNVLFDIAFAGPAASFLVSIPVIAAGLSRSVLTLPDPDNVASFLGRSLMIRFIENIYFPSVPANYEILWHPLVMAGWFGLLATAINLLPIGQLDGGHIFFSRFQAQAGKISILSFIFLIVMGLIFLYPGWIVFAVILLLLGLKHPKPQTPLGTLSPVRRRLVLAALLIFLLSFMPRPVIFY